MMKKTYFMRSFNLTIFLLITALFALLLGFSAKIILTSLVKNNMVFILQIAKLMKQSSQFFISFGLLEVAVALLLIAIEVVHRFKTDKIMNYFKSVYSTLQLRRFLTQTELTEKVMTAESQTVTTYNPINHAFNKAVSKSIVDIKQEYINIFIKVPKNQQAQKLLKEMELQIQEEIVNQNPDYYFSGATRVKNALWFKGKKREAGAVFTK